MYNLYTASQTSVVKGVGSSLTEMYIPLFVYSSGTVSTTATSHQWIQKGTTGTTINGNANTQLHTLNSNWNPAQKFALEVSIYAAGGGTVYAGLNDNSASYVSASQVSTTATTATLIRSGQFTLTPGHIFGVFLWCSSGTAYLTKAHLIAFLQ